MKFKNAIPYRITGPIDLLLLQDKLAAFQSREPSAQEFSTLGFVAPDKSRPDELFRTLSGAHFIKLKSIERVLPAAVINETVAKKIAEIEDRDGRKLFNKERATIKDETIFELLPKALMKSSVIEAFIDPRSALIVVNAASARKAEDVLSLLRKALDGLPVTPIGTKDNPNVSMAQWTLHPNSIPTKLKHGGKYALVAPDETAKKSRFSEYEPDEITEILDNGSHVASMSLEWDESLCFVFESDFRLKSIKDIQTAEIEPDENEDPFETDCILTHDMITRVVHYLIQCFAGEI